PFPLRPSFPTRRSSDLQGGSVQVWSTDGQPAGTPLRHDAAARSAQFSPDGLRVVTASDDEKARIWTLASGQTIVLPHQGIVSAADRKSTRLNSSHEWIS